MRANLITHPNAMPNENALYRFKKTFAFDGSQKAKVCLFADARYKLYVNGNLAAVGPLKGAANEKYYDEVDITPLLKKGENMVEAIVAQIRNRPYSNDGYKLLSVNRTGFLGFALWSDFGLNTDSEWLVAKGEEVSFISEPPSGSIGMCENILFTGDDLKWVNAINLYPLVTDDENSDHGNYGLVDFDALLKKRTIPMPYIEEGKFASVTDGIYDAGELTTSYIKLKIKGKGKVKLTYAECFVKEENGVIKKGDRADRSGVIIGDFDLITTEREETVFESFWFRCFRFIKAATEGDAEIVSLEFYKTGYPLKVGKAPKLDNLTDEKLWDISLRTLLCCIQESYTDCPYYEQLQYLMDTHLQTLYTYRVSSDYALAKKAVNDFALSQRPDGMIMSRFPTARGQIIPGFALIYPIMLYDYVKASGDIDSVMSYLPTVEKMLLKFYRDLDDNGLLKKSPYWNFVDWAVGWIRGISTMDKKESVTVYNLMYAYALQITAKLYGFIGISDAAEKCLRLADKINESVNALCFDEEQGLYADGNFKRSFSQHAQVWAVLSGAATGDKAKEIMIKSRDLTAKSSFAFAYYYFRALEKTDLYGDRKELLDRLRGLVGKNCTTVPETPDDERSECHAWGAVALYEFTAMDLGIRDINVPERTVLIEPYVEERDKASGSVPTVFGDIEVSWEKTDRGVFIKVKSPEEFKKIIRGYDGKVTESLDRVIELYV